MAFNIKYTFVDGTAREIEVSDEILWLESERLRIDEEHNEHTETRRHNSYNQMEEQGHGFADNAVPDPDERLLLQEEYAAVRAAFDSLSERDKRLLRLRADERLTNQRIADIEGVTEVAIRKRLKRLYRHICKSLF